MTTSTADDASAKVLKQIEFYFSDSNFPRDKFLRAEASKDPQGFVNIETIASFNRIKQITTDMDLIVAALRTSPSLAVSDDGKKVRRTAPLPTEDPSPKRTLYAKPFPEDVTLDMLTEFFSKHGEVLSVRLRKAPQNKKFKGSVFVEFATPEIAQKVLESDISYNDQKLTFMHKEAFDAQKKEEEKKKREDKKRKSEDVGEGEGKGKEAEKGERPYTTGLIIHITNIGTDKVPLQTMKATLGAFGKLSFVEYKPGDVAAYARFDTAEDAKNALEKLNNDKIEIGGQQVAATLLEGEDEKKYWEKIRSASKSNNNKNKKGGKRRRR